MIQEIYQLSFKNHFQLKQAFDGFINETKAELFDSEEECLQFYSQHKNLKRVKQAEIGNNLLIQYLAVTFYE